MGLAGIEPTTTSDYLVFSNDGNSNQLITVIDSETNFYLDRYLQDKQESQGIDKLQ